MLPLRKIAETHYKLVKGRAIFPGTETNWKASLLKSGKHFNFIKLEFGVYQNIRQGQTEWI